MQQVQGFRLGPIEVEEVEKKKTSVDAGTPYNAAVEPSKESLKGYMGQSRDVTSPGKKIV